MTFNFPSNQRGKYFSFVIGDSNRYLRLKVQLSSRPGVLELRTETFVGVGNLWTVVGPGRSVRLPKSVVTQDEVLCCSRSQYTVFWGSLDQCSRSPYRKVVTSRVRSSTCSFWLFWCLRGYCWVFLILIYFHRRQVIKVFPTKKRVTKSFFYYFYDGLYIFTILPLFRKFTFTFI